MSANTANTALTRFEEVTLAEFNRRLVEEQGRAEYNFKTYDELKDIHDNEGSTRTCLTGIAEHVMVSYIEDCSVDQINQLGEELELTNSSNDMQHRLMQVQLALFDKYICSPSPRQLKMMQMTI
jgi:hypothetical protein